MEHPRSHVPYRRSVTVIALSALLILGLAGGVVASDQFSDVDDSHTFHDEIGWMASSGVSQGYPDGTYRPGVDVTRGAMAAFMQRLSGHDPAVGPVVDAQTLRGQSPADLQGEPAVYNRDTLTYDQGASVTAGNSLTEVHEIGQFEKQVADSVVRLHLTSHALPSTDDTCNFQLRVDGANRNGDTSGLEGTEAIVQENRTPYTIETMFDGLGAGTHTVSLWVRGVGTDVSCHDNPGNYTRVLTVEELPAS